MDDFNDLFFFASVVQHKGFSAAARATGVEKTRLSRRVAQLERRLGVRLLQRSTRTLALTEAGQRFYERCLAAVEGAHAAYDSIADMQQEPSGMVRVSCPMVMAQMYLAPVLPQYMAAHPKVMVYLEATDRPVNLIEERFDLALRARTTIANAGGLVGKQLGIARRILVASPAFLARHQRPDCLEELTCLETISTIADMHDGRTRWELADQAGRAAQVQLASRLVSSDLRVQLEAAVQGIGITLLPEPIVSAALAGGVLEQVLPQWSAPQHVIHLVYPPPRGMLPSVRSLIDYLMIHLPPRIEQHSA